MSEFTPAKKKAYAAALLHLVNYLRLNEAKNINVENWCDRHKVKPDIITTLIALGAIVLDERKSDQKHYYLTRTVKLAKITPEDIFIQQMGDTPLPKPKKVAKAIAWESPAENNPIPQTDLFQFHTGTINGRISTRRWAFDDMNDLRKLLDDFERRSKHLHNP